MITNINTMKPKPDVTVAFCTAPTAADSKGSIPFCCITSDTAACMSLDSAVMKKV